MILIVASEDQLAFFSTPGTSERLFKGTGNVMSKY